MMKKRIVIALALALVLVLGNALAAIPQEAYAWKVVEEVNMERSRYGLGALRVDAQLTQAAWVRAYEIAEKFSHTRPDGTRWKTVYPQAYAENIARGQKTPDKAVAAWMTSENHRRNILREGYTSTGVACLKVGNVYHWVQLFGK